MKAIINRKVYDTQTADEIANNGILGQNCTRCTELYKTSKGAFFFYSRSQWQGENSYITPCSIEEAANFYEKACNHNVDFSEAFPSIKIEEA